LARASSSALRFLLLFVAAVESAAAAAARGGEGAMVDVVDFIFNTVTDRGPFKKSKPSQAKPINQINPRVWEPQQQESLKFANQFVYS
jgi:hypothetical protein